ncbi:zinc c3hc4 type family protein [Stylonychia lemnae]|uniref:Zinc c3hc4 type family protein n=1 Tax=Stylonychia lemnae TaxID=5949 RepID=A0A078B6N0_STYLE|nr:zinc c3hc4 type family protein [Stylonychia lemnae]|eukprot:CDW89218.1 zinc c3hc4 type family protein [Stylonychia lemnae]
MSEEFKNQSTYQVPAQNFSHSKSFNVGAQEFNPKKLGKQASKLEFQFSDNPEISSQNIQDLILLGINQNGDIGSQWVPQKKDAKKQWKRQDQQMDNIIQTNNKSKSQQFYQTKADKKARPNIVKANYDNPDYEHMDEIKSVQKQMSLQNQSANSLLGFTYQEDDYNNGQSYSNSYKGFKGKRRGGKQNYRPQKDYNIQSAFKFIVRRGKDYTLNVYDPNEIIDWKDVTTVMFNMSNADDVQCPICLENLTQMIAPKITKCGHIFCWPCVLQYLAYEKQYNWKRCPLCNESIQKNELKQVKVTQSVYYKEGSIIKFNLMIRNKANIIVSDKQKQSPKLNQFDGDQSDKKHTSKVKLPTQKFPSQKSEEFHGCRVLISDRQEEKNDYERDLKILMEDFKLMESSNEYQKIPYINEAIEHCHKEINKLNDTNYQDQIQEEPIDFQEKKRIHNKKQTLKNKLSQPDEIEENDQDFYYFYQSSTGENLFLHPLCYNILYQSYEKYDDFPKQIEAQVLEVNQGIADQDDPDFKKYQDLNHLPDGSPYGFVEVDMSSLVSESIYREFEKDISYRERHRKRKQQREEKYAGKVERIQEEKFEQIKRQAINSVNTESFFLVPGVVRNYEPRSSQDEESKQSEEEIKKEQEQEAEQVQNMTNDQKLWKEFGSLLVKDKRTIQSIRKDNFIGIEVKNFAKKAVEDLHGKEQDEFDCKDDGFGFASSSITVIEGKGPKKRKRGGRK